MKQISDLLKTNEFENLDYEFKLVLNPEKDKIEKWAKTLVGFSNTYGGTIFVGVNNDGDIVGIKRTQVDQFKNLVLLTINRSIFPHIHVDFDAISLKKNTYILTIHTDVSKEVVVFRKGDYNETVYIRENGATIPASVQQIISLGKRKFGIDNAITNESFQKNHFSQFFALAKEFRADHSEPDEQMLISKEIINKDGRITEGFKMFSDSYHDDNAMVVCRLWDGFDKGVDVALDIKEIKGPLGKLFLESRNFVMRNTRSGFVKMKDGSRLDTKSYPELALREAIVNAIAHRDFSIDGTQIDIDIFKNRIEIMSPGSWMLNGKPSDYEMNKIPSVRRNKIICNCFEVLGLMEKSGSGFKKIYSSYKDLNVPMAKLETTKDYFLITMYDTLYEHDGKNESICLTSKYDEEILKFCFNSARTRADIQNHISISSRSYFSTKILNPLLKQGLLIPTSSKNSKAMKYITNTEKYNIK